jgi:hypothetical protein
VEKFDVGAFFIVSENLLSQIFVATKINQLFAGPAQTLDPACQIKISNNGRNAGYLTAVSAVHSVVVF